MAKSHTGCREFAQEGIREGIAAEFERFPGLLTPWTATTNVTFAKFPIDDMCRFSTMTTYVV